MLEKTIIPLNVPEKTKQMLWKQERLFNETTNHFLLKWNKAKRSRDRLTSQWIREEYKDLERLNPSLSALEPMLRGKLFRDVEERYKHAQKQNTDIELISVDRSVRMKFPFQQVKQSGNRVFFSFHKEKKPFNGFSATTDGSLEISGFTSYYQIKRSRGEYILYIYHVQFQQLENYKPMILEGIQMILNDIGNKKGSNHLSPFKKEIQKTLQERIHTAQHLCADWDIRAYYQHDFQSFFVNIPLAWITEAKEGEKLVFRFYPTLKRAKDVKLQYADILTRTYA